MNRTIFEETKKERKEFALNILKSYKDLDKKLNFCKVSNFTSNSENFVELQIGRLLSLEILFASFLAGCTFPLLARHFKLRIFLALFLLFLAFILGIGYINPAYYHYRDDDYYVKRSSFIDGTNSPGNVFNTIWLKSIPPKEKEKLEFLKGEGKIILKKAQSSRYFFSINSKKNSEVIMNLAYYPGWEVYVNNVRGKINQTENGRFSFLLPSGQNNVEVVFRDTFIRKFAGFASFASIFLTLFLLKTKGFDTIKK